MAPLGKIKLCKSASEMRLYKSDLISSQNSSLPKPLMRNVYKCEKTMAVLAIALNGFTISNSVETISYDGMARNSDIYREMKKMNVKLLWCTDTNTYKRIHDIKQAYPALVIYAKKIDLKTIHAAKKTFKCCGECKSMKCHKFKVAAILAVKYDFPFNIIPH